MLTRPILKYVALTGIVASMILTGCNSPAKKLENARDKVEEANEGVIEANKDLNSAQYDSVQLFKKEAEEKIAANEKSIVDFKTRIAYQKAVDKIKYEKQIADLDQKNGDMRKSLADYQQQGKDKWVAFKHKFSHDMNELGKAFKQFTVSSK